MIDDTASGSVTIWTTTSFGTEDAEHTSKGNARSGCFFDSQQFGTSSASKISSYLHGRSFKTAIAGVPFIVIAHIKGETPWLAEQLCSTYPTLRSEVIRDFMDPTRQQRGTVALPRINKALNNDKSRAMRPSSTGINFAPIATWVSTSVKKPVILLLCRDKQVPTKLQEHLVSGNWQASSLTRNPARIFVDLLVLLSEWPAVWAMAREDLAHRSFQIHSDQLPLLQKTKDLHQDAADIIALREDLRLHVTAVRKFSVMLDKHRPAMETMGFLHLKPDLDRKDYYAERDELDEEVEDCLHNLLHQQESAAVIHKQLENLLSLAFNTEMVSQGQAVARLNYLAFIFLPLSFVAALFGMTRFTISTVWYPLWAFVVVSLVLLGFVTATHFPKNLLSIWKSKLKSMKIPTKDEKGKSTTPEPTRQSPKSSKLAWMKPNANWMWALLFVPVLGWIVLGVLFVVLRRRKANQLAPLAQPQPPQPYTYPQYGSALDGSQYPLPAFVDYQNYKVPSPMPQSHLHGAGLPPPMELQPPLASLAPPYLGYQQPPTRSGRGSDDPLIESSAAGQSRTRMEIS